jgi:hypothetical protein
MSPHENKAHKTIQHTSTFYLAKRTKSQLNSKEQKEQRGLKRKKKWRKKTWVKVIANMYVTPQTRVRLGFAQWSRFTGGRLHFPSDSIQFYRLSGCDWWS